MSYERTIPHRYLTTGSGEPLKFIRVTSQTCPDCGRGANPNKMAVLHEDAFQEVLHCVSCDCTYPQRRAFDATNFRPMNSGGKS